MEEPLSMGERTNDRVLEPEKNREKIQQKMVLRKNDNEKRIPWKIIYQNIRRLVTTNSKEKVDFFKEYAEENEILIMNFTETWLDENKQEDMKIDMKDTNSEETFEERSKRMDAKILAKEKANIEKQLREDQKIRDVKEKKKREEEKRIEKRKKEDKKRKQKAKDSRKKGKKNNTKTIIKTNSKITNIKQIPENIAHLVDED